MVMTLIIFCIHGDDLDMRFCIHGDDLDMRFCIHGDDPDVIFCTHGDNHYINVIFSYIGMNSNTLI
jgi:hypothetical protein